MTEDIVGQLQQFQQYAAGLHGLLEQAQASAPPVAEGTDRSGAVRAMLGPDGLPEWIRVEADWQHRLAPQAFGQAVAEACQVAGSARLAAWSAALQDQGLRSAADRLQVDDEAPLPTEPLPTEPLPAEPLPAEPLPSEWRRRIEEVRPRPLAELTEDVLRALDGVGELAAAPAPVAASGTGSDDSGRVSVTVSEAGLISCAANVRWASAQTGSALTTALAQALGAADTDLARAITAANSTAANSAAANSTAADATAPNSADNLDQLLAEALAMLSNPERLADS
jgi:hypothetical protein